MIVVPFRSKNPPERIPYATISLIVINTIVFLLTTSGWTIRDSVRDAWAVSNFNISILRLTASLFLHESPLHLIGNMLFLWIFGPATEGRLGILKFLALYTLSGFSGFLVQCAVTLSPCIGASGAIMGVAAAFMYMFPYSPIRVAWAFIVLIIPIRAAISDWLAWWVVGYYLLGDIILQAFSGGSDSVAHLAHIFGFATGLILVLLFRAKRDSEAVSGVQATRADLFNDISLLSYAELSLLIESSTSNISLVLAYCKKAVAQPGTSGDQKALEMINRKKEALLNNVDPGEIAEILLKIPPSSGSLPGPFYLKLGAKLEALGNASQAANIYRRIIEIDQNSPDSSAAIIRYARLSERCLNTPELARDAYVYYLELFSNGVFAKEAEAGIARLSQPGTEASSLIRQGKIIKQQVDDIAETSGSLPPSP
jgi:membrane associated rhomboid family serine protease